MNIKKLESTQAREITDLVWDVMIHAKQLPNKVANSSEFYMILYNLITKGIKDESLLCYGMLDNDKLIGMIGYEIETNQIIYLYVLPEYQKQGIGSKLLDIIINGVNQDESIMVRAHRDAVAMYEKYGFEKDNSDTKWAIGMTYTIRRK